MVGRTDPRQHKQLWRSYGACTKNDLPLCAFLRTVVLLLETDQGSALTFKQDVEGLDVGADREVRPARRRTQKSRGRTAAMPLPLRNLVGPKTLLVLTVEVGI